MIVGLTHVVRITSDDPPSAADYPAIAFRRDREAAVMNIGSLGDKTVEKHRGTGGVLCTMLDESAGMVELDVIHLEATEHAEVCVRKLTDGRVLSVNISIDEEASHASSSRDDDTVFGEDMACLDADAHVDSCTADPTVIVDFSGNDELVESAERALNAALDMVEAGAHTGKIDTEIENVIRGYGYTPVLNLSGHGAEQWGVHTDPTVPNRGAECGVELEIGDVVVVEPFTTDGTGKVTEGLKNEIYGPVNDYSVRGRMSHKLLDEVREEYKLLPFAARWFEGGRLKMVTRRPEQQGIPRGYPVLKEENGTMAGQVEDTIIATENGYENFTR